MKVLSSLAISAFLILAGSGASAQVIDDDTKCEAIESLSQAPLTGSWKLKETAGYIEVTMRALDRLHGQRGKTEIFPQMTVEARSSLVQAVMSRCHSRLAITVADTAIETYEAARSASPDLNKIAQKPSRFRYSRTAAPRQPQPAGSTGQPVENEL
jgi:hypothetical protein